MAPSFTQWDDAAAAPGSGTLLLEHGGRTHRVVMLLHGLTSSPPQFAAVAAGLHRRGATVFVPRFPRHGYTDRLTDALSELTADELVAFSLRALAFARDFGDEVVVAGFSLGGLLTALLAQREPLTRAVAVAPFLAPKIVPSVLRPVLIRCLQMLPNRFYWWDVFRRERQMPAHGYPRYPSRAIAQGLYLAERLVNEARRESPRTREIRIVLNASESAVSNSAARALARAWSRHPGTRAEVRYLRGLPLGHDVVEPLRNPAVAARALPALIEAIDG